MCTMRTVVDGNSVRIVVDRTPEEEAAIAASRAAERAENAAFHYTGDKFDPDRSVAEVIRLLKIDLKAAVAAGTIPPGRYIVTERKCGVSPGIHISTPAIRASRRGMGSKTEEDVERTRETWGQIGDIARVYNRCFEGRWYPTETHYRIFCDGLPCGTWTAADYRRRRQEDRELQMKKEGR